MRNKKLYHSPHFSMVQYISKRAAQIFSGASVATFGLVLISQLQVLPVQGQTSSIPFFPAVPSIATLPDIHVLKSGPATAQCKGSVSYAFSVKNHSTLDAQNVTFRDVVPNGLTFVSANIPQCGLQGNAVVCVFPTVNKGTNLSFSLRYTVNDSMVGAIANVATVEVQGGDANLLNNTSQAVVTQLTCPNLDTLTININGPLQQTYTSNQDDAVLADVNIVTSNVAIDMKNMFVAIQGQTSTGGSLVSNGMTNSTIASVLEDVQLRNSVTGQTISAVRLTDAGSSASTAMATYQVYRFDNFIVAGDTKWQLRVDFIANTTGHPLNGDKFRAHICTNVGAINTCTFGGMITATNTYNLVASSQSNGRSVTDVRPGGTVTGNFHRILNPQLNVAVKSIGTSDTAVKNSKNVNLLRFEARANEAVDILLTNAEFKAQTGSLLNAQNYALWVDTDHDAIVDTVLEKGVATSNGKVAFSNIAGGGYVVPKEQSITFEVHADISASLTNSLLQLAFDTTTPSYIDAENVNDGTDIVGIATNGACATTCQIIVTTVPSKIWNLVSQGDLFVSRDTESVRSRQLLGGTLGDSVLRLNFRAQNEDIEVTNLEISTWDTVGKSIDRLELYKVGETMPFASGDAGGCGTDVMPFINPLNGKSICNILFGFTNPMIIPRGQDLDVIVKARLKSDVNAQVLNIIVNGAISGESLKFWVSNKSILNNTKNAVRARGAQSSNNLSANNGNTTADGEVFIGLTSPGAVNNDIIGNPNQVVLSKIISIVNANPDADNTSVPSGVRAIGQFTFTTASNTNAKNGLNKATLSGVIFNVNTTNVATDLNAYKIYNKADASSKVPCTAVASTPSSVVVTCAAIANSLMNSAIDSGASTTFVLEANITNPKIISTSSSSLQVSLQNFSDISMTTFGTATSHLSWVDKDAGASTSFTWIEYPETVINSTVYKS